MNYEKKYKEIVGQLKKAYLYAQTDSTKAVLEEILPELKESEDEKVRKEIVRFIRMEVEDEIVGNKWLAWLEKQGEQKPVVIIPKFRIGDNIKTTNEEPLTITKIDGKGYWSEDLLVCDFDDAAKWELVEQKPADKVEPKFHEGDWVILTAGELSATLQIVNIDTNKKLYWFNDNSYLPIVDEGCLHLWTVQDAKEGDVLALKNDTTHTLICMSPTTCDTGSYCRLRNGYFIKNKEYGWASALLTPATKEQRDLLFQKMHEAGCLWDSESRQLLSLKAEPSGEQKPAWSEEDEKQLNDII